MQSVFIVFDTTRHWKYHVTFFPPFVVLFNHTTQQMVFFESAARFLAYYIQYNNMLKYFFDNKVISPKQSGLRPGDSYVNQLLSVSHETSTSFNNGLEVRTVHLDISKAFEKVWCNGLIYKLKQSVKDKLLHLLKVTSATKLFFAIT